MYDLLDNVKANEDAVRASFNLNLSEQSGEQPDLVLSNHIRAKEQNLPYRLIQGLDNTQLYPKHDASGYDPAFQKLLASNYDMVGMVKDDLKTWDELSRQVNHREGEPTVGPTKTNWAKMQYKNFRDRGVDVEKVIKDEANPDWMRRKLVGEYIRDVETTIGVINVLNAHADKDWQSFNDEKLKRLLNNIKESEGWDIDVDSINLEMLRKRNISDLGAEDFLQGFTAYNMVELGNALGLKVEEIMSIDERNPVEQQLMKLSFLMGMLDDERGMTTGGQIGNVLAQMPGFAIEFAATCGLTKVAAAGAKGGTVSAMASAKEIMKQSMQQGLKSAIKAIPKAMGVMAKGEAKRIGAFTTQEIAQAYVDIQQKPLYWVGEDGLEVQLSEDRSNELGTVIVQNILKRYLENFSENMGVFIPEAKLAKILPNGVKKTMAAKLLFDIGQDSAKRGIVSKYISENLPFQGMLGELGEEYFNKYVSFLMTDASKLTGIEALDMGEDTPYWTAEDVLINLAASAVYGNTQWAVGLPSRLNHIAKINSWVDDHRATVEKIQATKLNSKSSAFTAEVFNQLREDNTVYADIEDIEAMYQSAPEFISAVGITPEQIASAKESGKLVEISENKMLLAQAQSPEFNSAGEQLLTVIRPDGRLNLTEVNEIDLSEEAQAQAEERRAFKLAVQSRISELKALGRSQSEINRVMTIFNRLASTVEKLTPEKAIEFLDRIKFVKPEDFGKGEFMGQIYPVYTGSAADYDNPSTDFIGSGEGAQVFGWGLYGSSDRKVADWYARTDYERKRYSSKTGVLTEAVGAFMVDKYVPTKLEKLERFKEDLLVSVEQQLKSQIRTQEYLIEIAKETGENYDNITKRLSLLNEALDALDNEDLLSYIDHKGRNVYEQTFWADKKENLLDWEKPITEDNINSILEALASDPKVEERVFEFVNREKSIDADNEGVEFEAEGYYPFDILRDELERYTDFYQATGGYVYTQLSDILGSPKGASEFLYRAGIDGITYIGESSGVRNYVAFSDKDVRIDRHIQWQSVVPGAKVIAGVQDITDDDFSNPTQSFLLPPLPYQTLSLMGRTPKPVLLKKNILEKNRKHHSELTAEDSRKILDSALYHSELVGQTQPDKRPNYWVSVKLKTNKNAVVVLEIAENKDNYEIVGWRFSNDKGLKELQKQANREGGQILDVRQYTQPPSDQTGTIDSNNIHYVNQYVKSQSNKNEEKYRGGYLPPSVDEFLSKKHEITLFEHADASTVIHEIAHYTFKTLEYFVNAGLADTQLVEDFAKLQEWAEEQGGDFHENLAKGFEAYIMEGVAPVSSLTSIFATMARMMKQIYKDVKNLGVALSDDVRQIFDSYLTSADEVERDSALVKVANAINLGLLGLNQKEAKEFTKLINSAKEQQVAELTKEKNKQLKVQRKLWKKESDELISQDRVLNARRAIEKEGKLDYSAVKDLAGDYIADKLKEMGLTTTSTKSGKHPVVFAETYGFPSVESMIDSLMDSQSPKEFTDEYMQSAEESFNKKFELTGEAQSSALNIQTWDKLTELLAERGGREGYRVRQQILKKKALGAAKALTVKQLLSDGLELKNVENLTSDLVKAINKKDFITALSSAEKIRENLEIIRAKNGIKHIVERTRKLLKKGRTAKEKTIWGYSKEALQELSERFGFSAESKLLKRKNVADVINAINSEREALEEPPIEIADFILDDSKPYTELSYDEFLDLYHTIELVYGYGKEVVSESKEAFKQQVSDWSEGFIEVLADMPEKYTQDKKSVLGYAKFATRTLINSGTRLHRLMYKLGKYDDSSTPVELYNEMSYAASQHTNYMAEPLHEIKSIIETLGDSLGKFDFSKLPKLPDDVVARGGKWDRGSLISVLLNMGTDKNRKALRDGFYWSDEDIASIANKLDYNQWGYIQKIWDIVGNGSLTHEWRNAYRKEFYSDPVIEEASPFTVESNGATFEVIGGYYPLRYQFLRNGSSQDKVEAKKKLLTVNRTASFNHKRTEQGAGSPISLSPNEIFHHIYDVAHYVSHHDLMRKVQRVINNYEVSEKIKRTYGFEYYKAMKTIIDNITAPSELMHDELEAFFQKTKSFLVSQSLWGNVQSVVRQVGSWSVGLSDVKGYYMEAVTQCITNAQEMYDIAFAKSGFMRDRHNLKDYDLQEAFTTLDKNEAEKALYKLQQAGFAPMRWADMKVALPLWHAMYRKSLDEGMDDKEAVAKADEFVAATQGGNRAIDRSVIQLSRLKFFAVFMSAAGAYFNKNMETVDKIKFGKISTAEGVYTLALEGLLPAAASGLISWVFAGGLGDDDEDKATRAFWRTILTEPISGMPIIRDIADFAIGKALGNRGGQKVALEHSYLRGVNTIIDRVFNPVSGPFENDVYNFLYSTSKVISELYNVPVIDVYERAKKIAQTYDLIEK